MPRDAELAVQGNTTAPLGNINATPLSVEAQPITVHNSIQSTKTSTMATQLSQALGVASDETDTYAKNVNSIESKQGEIDAQKGITQGPQAANYKSYRDAQDHVHALASWAVDEQDIAHQLEHQGFAQNPDSKQGLIDQNNYLNQTYKDRYAGSSPATMATLAPKMAELRNSANADFQRQQQQMTDSNQQGQLKTITGSAFGKAFTPTVDPQTGQPFTDSNGKPLGGGMFDASKFDYEGINKNVRSLYPGAEGNTLMLSNLADLAKTKGIPELLTNMPDRWADGTPTPKGSGDPKVVNQFREDVKQAQEQKDMFLKHADAMNEKAQKDLNRKSEAGILDNILSGRNMTPALHAYAQQAGADPSFIEKAANWQHERWKQGQEDALDNGQTATMVSDVISGKTTTRAQLLQSAQDSHLTGKPLEAFLTKGLATMTDADKVDQNDPESKAYIADLSGRYKPGLDMLGNITNAAAAQQHANVLLDYQLQRVKGTDAKTAWQTAQKNAGPPVELAEESKKPRILATDDADRAKVIARGDQQELASSGVTGAQLRRLRDSGQITPEQAAKAATTLLHLHKP